MSDSDPQTPLVRIYQHPFNDDDADYIIRSQDGVDFRVHRYMLSRASTVLTDMFPVPRGLHNSSLDVQLPVVDLPEGCELLDFLFRCIYDLDLRDFQTWGLVQPLLDAAIKYDVKKAMQLVE